MSAQSLKALAAKLRSLPRVVAQRVATASAPAISTVAAAAFNRGEDPYGVAWAPGADGKRVTLRKTGSLARFLRYVAVGTRLRVALGVPYAKYQIGKRPVFPTQGGALPQVYVDALAQATAGAVSEAVRSS